MSRCGACPDTPRPAREVAVVACTDARLDVYRILGPDEVR